MKKYGLFEKIKRILPKYNKAVREKDFKKQEKIVKELKLLLEKLLDETNTNLYILKTNELIRK